MLDKTERPRSGQAKGLEKLLDEARKRLIDNGTRNRLVHTKRKSQKPATLAIAHPDPGALFQRLVIEKSSCRFVADPSATKRERQLGPEDDPEEIISDRLELLPAPGNGGLLQTRLGEGGLQKKLTRFYREAKTLEEEQGVNILFLAMGFLQWYEADESKILREGPLVLVPVSLVRDARRSTFTLKPREDDIATNLPLAERLREQGISLPDIPECDEWDLSGYFDKVAEAISTRVRWAIDKTGLELGFFSFAKLLMYRDLGGRGWPNASILSHPLLRGLLHDGFPHAEPLFPDNTKIDERFQPADLIHVLDADGSQTLAIETVRAGRNLVIYGPPGTGKSQTIANIIAAAIHDGKSVLFVAEKMAALNVVHSRLRKAGLGKLCLELHSQKANKGSLARELKETLNSGAAEPGLMDLTESLTKTRDSLNRIARDLHAPIGETGMSAFLAMADLVRAKGLGLPPPSGHVPEMRSWTKSDFEAVMAAADTYATIAQASGSRGSHPWRGTRNTVLTPLDLDRIVDAGRRASELLRELAETVNLAADLLPAGRLVSLASVAQLLRFVGHLANVPEGCAEIAACLHSCSERQLALAELMIGEVAAVLAAIETEAETFLPAALKTDAADLRSRLTTGKSWLSRWKRTYREASTELGGCLTEPLPKSAANRIRLAERLIAFQANRNHFEELSQQAQTIFESLWRGEATNLVHLKSAIAWLRRAGEKDSEIDISPALNLLERPDLVADYRNRLRQTESAALSAFQSVISRLELDSNAAFGTANIGDVALETLALRLDEWTGQPDCYFEWRRLLAAGHTLHTFGLSHLVSQIDDGALTHERARWEARYERAELLWTLACERCPRLVELRDLDRTKLVEDFRQLETDRRELAAALIRTRHSAQLPEGAVGPMAIIRGEIARLRGHMPIRRLVQRVGPTIQKIKPVFLMSPISVAQFLPPGAMKFDLLVIDEASQVRPEDALGVIARANQMVIVGDGKQLPPTDFFNRLLSDEGVDEDENSDDADAQAGGLFGAAKADELESVLTLCEARGVEAKMLRWHYRSRHPSLIEVSNDAFYERSLFLPPSPAYDRDAEGLVLKRVRGAYDRGGKRTNEIEATDIVDALIDHAARNPDKSAGVVTFSTKQRDLILNLLEHARRREPALDGYLSDQTDETFVKNLENVQGDERDHIFVSIGYGPRKPGGRLESMNFGPVSKDGGERRLNVLFTRARYRCEVFCSFDPADINSDRATSKGVKVLKRYLTFAETGVLDGPASTGKDYDSPFEEDVARVITRFGFLADPQVGTAGFKIDIGVRDPDRPGRYILAVECDGAAYHGALWARERDRLRQEILEGQGWRFHRIWSTDWFYRRSEEIQRLKSILEAARQGQPGPTA